MNLAWAGDADPWAGTIISSGRLADPDGSSPDCWGCLAAYGWDRDDGADVVGLRQRIWCSTGSDEQNENMGGMCAVGRRGSPTGRGTGRCAPYHGGRAGAVAVPRQA